MFEIIVHDYDAAPDAETRYFLSKRKTSVDLLTAKNFAEYEVEERFAVGATVFENKKPVYSVGMQFSYVPYPVPNIS